MFKEIWEAFLDKMPWLKSKILIVLSVIFLAVSAVLYPMYWYNTSSERITCTFIKCEDVQETSYVWGEPRVRYYTNFHFEMTNNSAYDISEWRGDLVVTDIFGNILSTTEINTFAINWIKSKETLSFYVSLDESTSGYVEKILNANDQDLTATINITSRKFIEKAIYLKEMILVVGVIYPIFLFTFLCVSLNLIAYLSISKIENRTKKVMLKIIFIIPYLLGFIHTHIGSSKRRFAVNTKGKVVGYYDEEKEIFVDNWGRPMFPDDKEK